MLSLPKNPTLKNFQKYVSEMEKERGFEKDTLLQKCLLLGEEVGELFKAVRKSENIKIDHNSKFNPVDYELADVLIYLCEIANRFNIDLEKAFREKEEINKKRVWEKDK
ncbi:MAG: MazG nucleotide pyrophosphohydrolase domain-containing protein [Patescibacteria group bacterium]|jgi:NTP pyrophosphatase (non-canonical NTP hydrolase)